VASEGKKAQSEARKERLAAALRENLKRRKAQARAKAVASPRDRAGGAQGPAPGRPNPAANKGQ
jgi:hypothetical protein